MIVHAQFHNGPLDGSTFSSDSADPKYAALAKLVYGRSESFRVGARICWDAQAIKSARDSGLVNMLPLFLEYCVLRSSCEPEAIRAWFYHIPAVG